MFMNRLSLLVAGGGTRLLNGIKWLDDKMWNVAMALPISYWAHPNNYKYSIRLTKYAAKIPDVIREVKLRRRRYDPDTLHVYLTQQANPQECRVIADEISPIMDNGWLDVSFLYNNEVLARYVLMNGKDYVPTKIARTN